MVTRIVPALGIIEPLLDKTGVSAPAVLPPDAPGGPPVFTWEIPDRQCVGRLDATQCSVMNVDESIQHSMDFSAILARNGATIVVVNLVTAFDEEGLPTTFVGSEVTIIGVGMDEVVFGISIPDGGPEQDLTVIAQIVDSEGNQYNGCGCLRVRHCK